MSVKYYEVITGIDPAYPGWGRPARGALYRLSEKKWHVYSYWGGWDECPIPQMGENESLVLIDDERARELRNQRPAPRFRFAFGM